MQSAKLIILIYTISPILSARILYLSPLNATSHHMWNSLLVNKLAERGHHVTYIGASPNKDKPHANIEYHVREQSEISRKAFEEHFRVSLLGTPFEKVRLGSSAVILDCEEVLKTPPYQKLADPKNNATFDLIIMEYFGFSCLLPLTQRLGSPPVIFTHPCTTNPPWLQHVTGIPVFPMIPHTVAHGNTPMGIWDRFRAYLLYFYKEYQYYTRTKPEMEKIYRKYFGEDVLPLNQYHEKVALSLVNIP